MFIKVGSYTIDTNSVTYIRHHENSDQIEIYFMGGVSVRLQGADAAYLLKALERNP